MLFYTDEKYYVVKFYFWWLIPVICFQAAADHDELGSYSRNSKIWKLAVAQCKCEKITFTNRFFYRKQKQFKKINLTSVLNLQENRITGQPWAKHWTMPPSQNRRRINFDNFLAVAFIM